MGKRYYCEFCDKVFADNPTNKRNHLKGVFHQRMRKLHYDAFREPEVILAEESSKMPCRRFETTGNCDFGDSCRYSHLTSERKQQLEARIRAKKEADSKKHLSSDKEIRLEDWLVKRRKLTSGKMPESSEVTTEQSETPVYTLPPVLQNIPNLPPSLLPPPPDACRYLERVEWG